MNGFVDKATLNKIRKAAERFRLNLKPTTTIVNRYDHWMGCRNAALEIAVDDLLEIVLTIGDAAVEADGADVAPFSTTVAVSAMDGFREIK